MVLCIIDKSNKSYYFGFRDALILLEPRLPTKAVTRSPGKTRVFLSYSRSDREIALAIRSGLESASDIELLQDIDTVSPGEKWWPRITELIAVSDRVLFIASPTSITSDVCADELDEARRANKLVLPVILDGVDWRLIPSGASRIHGFAVRPENPQSVQQLVQTLRTEILANVNWVRQNTRYHELAHRWEQGGKRGVDLLRGDRLRELRRWMEIAPPAGEGRSPLLSAYLERGRHVSGRRTFAAAITVVLITSVAAIAGLMTLIYRADQTVNAGNIALEAGDIAGAQMLFLQWAEDTATKLLPVPPTANTLATRLLNTGLELGRYQLKTALKPSEEIARYHGQNASINWLSRSVYVLFPVQVNSPHEGGEPEEIKPNILVRCSLKLEDCTQIRIEPTKGIETALLVHEDTAYLSFTTAERSLQFSAISKSGTLQHTALTDPELVAKLTTKAVRDSSADLSRDPYLARAEAQAESGPTKFYSEETVAQAACDPKLENCVMQFLRDARGTVFTFGLWQYKNGQKSEGDKAEPESWMSLSAAFYSPPLTRNSMSMSSDGKFVAIAADHRVSLWDTGRLREQQTAPFKEIDVGADIIGLQFGQDRTLLYVATQAGLVLLNLDPRAGERHHRPGAKAIAAPSEDLAIDYDILGGKVKISATYQECALHFGADPAQHAKFVLPSCPVNSMVEEVGVVASSPNAALVAASYFNNEDPQLALILVDVSAGEIRITPVATPPGITTGAWDDDTIGLKGDPAFGVLSDGITATTYAIVDGKLVVGSAVLPVSTHQAATTPEARELPLIRTSEDSFLHISSATECTSSDSIRVAFLVAQGSILRPQFRACIESFPLVGDANGKVGVVTDNNAGAVYFGHYDFGGIIEWNPGNGVLAIWRTKPNDQKSLERKVLATRNQYDPLGRTIKISRGTDADPRITDGALSADSGTLAYFARRGGSMGSAYGVNVLDLSSGGIKRIDPPSAETFDYVSNAELSPNGRLILVTKQYSGHSLFDVSAETPFPLPSDVVEARLVTEGAVAIELLAGVRFCWSVPEAIDTPSISLLQQLKGLAPLVSCDFSTLP